MPRGLFHPGIGIVVVLVVGACVSSDTSVCPSGALCASGARCVVVSATELCVSPSALDDCAEKLPGDTCGAGRCYESEPGAVCLTAACGNDFVESYDEACDDGNNSPGDGCAGDCRSDETCGNGLIDLISGETCDDGNFRSHDGCASTCVLEVLEWQQSQFNPTFLRTGYAVVFDSRRGEAIAFGGRITAPGLAFDRNDIRTWRRRQVVAQNPAISSAAPPAARAFHAMAFDDVRGVVVMFGGEGGYADTWEWNGRAWSGREVFGPPPRSQHVMAYDRARRRVVMFGGVEDVAAAGDVWEWDGSLWEQRTIAGAPPGSTAQAATYDPAVGRIVVITTQGTWAYDGTAWTQASTGHPDATQLSAAFDTERQQVIALGVAPGGTTHLWALDGTTWVDLGGNSAVGPAVLTYDPARHRAIAWGAGTFGNPLKVYEWAGGAWTSFDDATSLPLSGVFGAAGASDELQHRVVLFGGSIGSTYVSDTWIYDGARWTKLSPSTNPGARAFHAMAYDAERAELILFGGRDSTSTLADTWVWSNETWTLRTPGRSPPARRGHAMAYDPARRRVVLFSGSSSATLDAPIADTWEWDGTTWTEVVGAGPPGRSGATLAFDRASRSLVYFDGAGLGVKTWTYDGTWHPVSEAVTPSARGEPALAWDASRRRLVVYGGTALNGTAIPTLGDVWERVAAPSSSIASSWRRLPASPVERHGHVALSSPNGAGLVTVYGDGNGILATPSPAILQWRGTAPEETCAARSDGDGDGLAGCDDPDCEHLCAPRCVGDPGCSLGPRCGDGACDLLETSAICAVDCGAPPVICGDTVCDSGETCIGDCAAQP